MKKSKLLHISLGSHNSEMWRSFERNFDTRHYDWSVKQGQPFSINADIINLFNEFKPDVVFMQLQSAGVVSVPTLQLMSKESTTVLFGGDVRLPIPQWELELGRHVDLSLHVNNHYVNELSREGVNCQYIDVGFDEKTFNPEGSKNEYPDIVFLGSNYSGVSNFPLSPLRYEMVQRLKRRYGDNFMAYGTGWKQLLGTERFLQQQQESECYRSCKIAINLSHFDYSRYYSDRMIRMMGSGAFCLSHHYKDIEENYKVGKHLATWNGIDNLIDSIDYYLDNPEEREKIRIEGCNFVRDSYTWNHFMIELKKKIGIKS